MTEPLIQVEQFSVGYINRQGQILPVVRDVSLSLERGTALGLVGESGCGKSTLSMALLAHLRNGSSVLGGRVLMDGVDIFQLDHPSLERLRWQRVAFVPQNASQALTPTMRIGSQATEALTLYSKLTPELAQQRVCNLFQRMRLPQPEELLYRYPHELSGGQQQRVVIAMALARHTDVIVLDEPTTGLDVTTQMHVLQLLKTMRQECKLTLLYVSHDLDVIARVSDHVAVMYAGEVVEIAPVTSIFTHPRHPYTLGLLQSLPRMAHAGLPPSIPYHPLAPHEARPACIFAPRCTFATRLCVEQSPPFVPVDAPSHRVRCHHWQTVGQAREKVMFPTGNGHGSRIASASTGTMRDILLKLQDVGITYARHGMLQRMQRQPVPPATVSNVSLDVQRGETLALVGESGSGKTTLLRAIAGLKRPCTGRITFGDIDLTIPVDRRSHEMRRLIQIIFQNPDGSLNPRQTVARILEQPLRLYFNLSLSECQERTRTLLEQVRLSQHYQTRFPGQLSGGEKQRVAIARAFAAEPELVLCDEVTSALDVSVQSAVLEVLSDLQDCHDVTYLFITHNLAIVRAIANRVAIFYHGRMCEICLVTQLVTPPWHPYTKTLLAAMLESKQSVLPTMFARDVPDPSPPAYGCPFQRRCPHHRGPICDEELPPWQSNSNTHRICCHIPLNELAREQM
jgi:peptide/nickel transport system ATP-binding protein